MLRSLLAVAVAAMLPAAVSAGPYSETTIVGKVKSMDKVKWEAVIARANGKETTVIFETTSRARLDGRDATLDAIEPGQDVVCNVWSDTNGVSDFDIYKTTKVPFVVGISRIGEQPLVRRRYLNRVPGPNPLPEPEWGILSPR